MRRAIIDAAHTEARKTVLSLVQNNMPGEDIDAFEHDVFSVRNQLPPETFAGGLQGRCSQAKVPPFVIS